MTCLEDLNLSENEIANCEDLKNMPNLKTLNMNTNKMTTLAQLPAFPSLDSLDFGVNAMDKPDSIAHLSQYKKLTKFAAAGNPMEETLSGGLKGDVLFRLYPGIKLKMIGEDEVTEDDIAEWKASRKQRIKD